MSQPISKEELKAMRDHALRVGRDPYYAEDPDAKNVLRLADAYDQALKDKEQVVKAFREVASEWFGDPDDPGHGPIDATGSRNFSWDRRMTKAINALGEALNG